MKRKTTLALLIFVLPLVNGCVTTTNTEGQVMFSDALRQHGTNPYIENPVVKDLERRIRAIASAPIVKNSRVLGPRNREILRNFEDRFDYNELMTWIDLSRAGSAARTLYPKVGNNKDCKILGDTAAFPTVSGKSETFDWILKNGECQGGKAHGIGIAVTRNGNLPKFQGRFDNGMMIEGVFEMTLDDGRSLIQIGGVTNDVITARALTSIYDPNGISIHRFGDFNDAGVINGFGIHIRNYTNMMVVLRAGDMVNDRMHGFSAVQALRKWGDGKVWHVWLGEYRNGKGEGLLSWTNGVNDLIVAEYKNGKKHGVSYEQYVDVTGDYHEFMIGTFQNGKKHGTVRKKTANSFNDAYYVTETYSNGHQTGTSDQPPINMGQIFAIAAGAAVIGASDISEAAKIEVAGALTADVIGNTGGTNMASLQSSFAQRAQSVSSGNTGNTSSSSSAGGNGITVEQVPISCPDTGVSNTIPVPYRTQICRRAAIDFATTYACNKLDQERVARNCEAACGNSQCLQN